MTNMKHAPGPWKFISEMYGIDNMKVFGVEGGIPAQGIANCGYDEKGESEANARLIATAPELLQQLRNILDRLEATIERLPDTQENAEWEQECVNDFTQARALIAKATGN